MLISWILEPAHLPDLIPVLALGGTLPPQNLPELRHVALADPLAQAVKMEEPGHSEITKMSKHKISTHP